MNLTIGNDLWCMMGCSIQSAVLIFCYIHLTFAQALKIATL